MLKPDQKLQATSDKTHDDYLKHIEKRLSLVKKKEINLLAKELDQINSTPNTEVQLKSLPQLKVLDLPQQLPQIATTASKIGSITILRNHIFSNNVIIKNIFRFN